MKMKKGVTWVPKKSELQVRMETLRDQLQEQVDETTNFSSEKEEMENTIRTLDEAISNILRYEVMAKMQDNAENKRKED
jgi:predicted nuclease with TOPRIM domain